MNDSDRALLNSVQSGLPVCARPFAEIGRQLGMTEDEVCARLARLRDAGVIRRIGAVFDSRRLGYTTCLVAARVPAARLEEVAAAINRYPGVTHNYVRTHAYNLWFTLGASSPEMFERILARIRGETGIADLRLLPATRVFQSRVRFHL